MNNEIKELKEKAIKLLNDLKNQTEEFMKFLKNDVCKYTSSPCDAKLYDVAYECDDDYKINLFHEFCNDNWNNFQEYLSDHYCYIDYIGRTSSFHIKSKTDNVFNYFIENWLRIIKNYGKKFSTSILELIELIVGYYPSDYNFVEAYDYNFENMEEAINNPNLDPSDIEFEELPYSDEKSFYEYVIDNIEFYILEDKDDFYSEFKDPLDCYKNLFNFKENQLKYWHEYLEIEQERIEEYLDDTNEEIVEAYHFSLGNFNYVLFNDNKKTLGEFRDIVYNAVINNNTPAKILKEIREKGFNPILLDETNGRKFSTSDFGKKDLIKM